MQGTVVRFTGARFIVVRFSSRGTVGRFTHGNTVGRFTGARFIVVRFINENTVVRFIHGITVVRFTGLRFFVVRFIHGSTVVRILVLGQSRPSTGENRLKRRRTPGTSHCVLFKETNFISFKVDKTNILDGGQLSD